MEMVLSSGFCEMTMDEVFVVDGGIEAKDVFIGIAGFAVGAAVGFAVAGPAGALFEGCRNAAALTALTTSVASLGADALTVWVLNEMVND